VPRRTVSLPQSVDDLVHRVAEEGESYSAAVARLVEAGARATRTAARPRYVGSAANLGPRDFARHYERYVDEALAAVGKRRA